MVAPIRFAQNEPGSDERTARADLVRDLGGEKALSPEEARAVFAASPFGRPVSERMLLDGCFWVFEVRRA